MVGQHPPVGTQGVGHDSRADMSPTMGICWDAARSPHPWGHGTKSPLQTGSFLEGLSQGTGLNGHGAQHTHTRTAPKVHKTQGGHGAVS